MVDWRVLGPLSTAGVGWVCHRSGFFGEWVGGTFLVNGWVVPRDEVCSDSLTLRRHCTWWCGQCSHMLSVAKKSVVTKKRKRKKNLPSWSSLLRARSSSHPQSDSQYTLSTLCSTWISSHIYISLCSIYSHMQYLFSHTLFCFSRLGLDLHVVLFILWPHITRGISEACFILIIFIGSTPATHC